MGWREGGGGEDRFCHIHRWDAVIQRYSNNKYTWESKVGLLDWNWGWGGGGGFEALA